MIGKGREQDADSRDELDALLAEAGYSAGGGSADRAVPFSVRYRRRGGSGVMSLNLTPMIDVVFLLLFFFLAVSRFKGTEGMLPAHLPARTGAVSTEIPRTPIRIRFVADDLVPDRCRVRIERFGDGTAIPISELAAALAAVCDPERGLAGFDTDTPVHLLAGDHVRWDHVVNAYNAALAARYEKVFFAGSP